MKDLSEKLSAYLDGELDEADAMAIEAILAEDPAAQAELDALIEANAFAQEKFEGELDTPIPFALAQQIKSATLEPKMTSQAGPQPRPIWGALAAGIAIFCIGGLGGYALNDRTQPVQTAGWLAQIADYHAVYAAQNRHLVEVGADEADHIETWLGNTVGASFSIPDLTSLGLTFEGGRLVVAAGKPVAQLMYRKDDGTVIALCLQQSNKETTVNPTFNERTIKGFDFVSWSEDGADYVVIGPQGLSDLIEIASAAALEI